MKQPRPLKCQCGNPDCYEVIECDRCGRAILEEEPHYVLSLELITGNNKQIGREILQAYPVELRCIACGIEDVTRKLGIEDPQLDRGLRKLRSKEIN